jgi:hypothetical protein
VFVGVLGGFTTFSAFAYETTILLRDSRLVGAWLNVGLEVFFRLDGSLARQPIVSINLTVFCAPPFSINAHGIPYWLVRSRNIGTLLPLGASKLSMGCIVSRKKGKVRKQLITVNGNLSGPKRSIRRGALGRKGAVDFFNQTY